MKSKIYSLVLVTAMFASCSNNSNNTNQTSANQNANQNVNQPKTTATTEIKDVENRKNFGSNAIITPLPAIMIATYDQNNNPDVMMAAWGGQCGPHHITFVLSPHKTTENIRLKNVFTVSFASKKDIAESDYFGIVSANDVPDKVAKAGFTAIPSPNVDAPIIKEYPLTLECRVVSMKLNELDETAVIGEVVNMSVDSSILDENGNVDINKLQPVIYNSSNRTYHVVGEEIGGAWKLGNAIKNR